MHRKFVSICGIQLFFVNCYTKIYFVQFDSFSKTDYIMNIIKFHSISTFNTFDENFIE